jgi:3-hydroxyisobutyrate dehydrogenase-like beta-hydroxyacid dehydrogenase
MKMKIGFIGLGIMGSRMAANLQKHGYSLVVFNRTRAKAQPLLDKGASFAESPAKLAEQADVLFTMLAHPDAVEQAALGRNGFLSHLKSNALWVDCSSVNPSFSKKMAAEAVGREVHFVDAPVTGSYAERGSDYQPLGGMEKSGNRAVEGRLERKEPWT